MTVPPDASDNAHLADPILKPFLAPSFSPIAYLNATLPSASSASASASGSARRASSSSAAAPSAATTTTTTQPQPSPSPVPLSALAAQTQSHVAALTAQTARLSATLTALTDEILRTGARLAYEVELLRGDAVALTDALGPDRNGEGEGGLWDDMRQFVDLGDRSAGAGGGGVGDGRDAVVVAAAMDGLQVKNTDDAVDGGVAAATAAAAGGNKDSNTEPTTATTIPSHGEPPSLPRLRTLLHVRAHLQSTIAVFNTALSFPLPPPPPSSSTGSGSGPNPTTTPSSSAEDTPTAGASADLSTIRTEIQTLLQAGEVARARDRVAEWKEVCGVWRGTAEEKARVAWVEDVLLKGLVERFVNEREREREREREKDGGGGRKGGRGGAGGEVGQAPAQAQAQAHGQGKGESQGWMRRLRDEIYAE